MIQYKQTKGKQHNYSDCIALLNVVGKGWGADFKATPSILSAHDMATPEMRS